MAMTTPNDDGKGGESLVDRDSHFDGLYKTKHNLRVEGEAEGDIQCQGTLTVEQGARVKAKVAASNVTVAGELEGEVVCQDVFKITPTGQVEAMVTARRLIVQEGGFYNGEFHMTKDEGVADTSERTFSSLSTDEWLARLPGGDSWDQEAEEEEPEPD